MGVILYAIYRLLDILIWVIIIECILSWIPSMRYSSVYRFLQMITEPIQGPIRNLLSRYVNYPVDFSPLVAMILLELIQKLLFVLMFR
ncbi:MAG: YggT family protein [Clostridioides sp.]|jgi:YggT family protein|nr:YggT family protein [Clostridioides sp.]